MHPIVYWPLVLFIIFSYGSSLRWHMPPNSQKCIQGELRQNILVKGVYEVAPINGLQVDYTIKDSHNHILSQKEDITSGKFTITVETDEMFEICFISKVLNKNFNLATQEIYLDIKSGVEAQSYEGVAETLNLKPLELNLKRLEDFSKDIVLEFKNMKKRVKEMRNTNESTNERLLYFRLLSMTCLIIFSVWQAFYLRHYFITKKLI